MNKEELIEVLRQFDEKRVEELPEKARNIFYAIMKIADERDELKNIINEAIGFTNSHFKEMVADEEAQVLLNILNKGDNKDVKKNNTHSN